MPRSSDSPRSHLGSRRHSVSLTQREVLPEDFFRRVLCWERKRAERSGNSFLLVLLDAQNVLQANPDALAAMQSSLCSSTRETDIVGWYRDGAVLGVIFTETDGVQKRALEKLLRSRLTAGLQKDIGQDRVSKLQFSFYFFPEGRKGQTVRAFSDATLYPDLQETKDQRKLSYFLKRAIDVVGSILALILFAPFFIAAAAAIKLTSKGPVFFKQQRVGQFGRRFTFLKFRSMKPANNPAIHREYVKRFIAGKADAAQPESGQDSAYKIQNDPRVTRVGRFLRRTSFDELPQLINVLKGEMSLVGPRPPIPYELESYQPWHFRRILEAKPGITGLWQVRGRSRTKFDDMVRLDLRYARTWSPWLDLKILLQTPRAVLSGDGAY